FTLLEARERGVPLPTGVRVEDLTSALDDEITTMINEVNGVHALRPDNVVGAPAPLPREVALLTMDQVHLARDLAPRLIAHVRVDVEEADGTIRSRWVDAAGRVHAFDPASERWVDPQVWRALATAPRVALTPLLTRAAELRYTTEFAHDHLVRHLREQGRAGGPLVLTDGQSARIARYRAIREWAESTVEAAVRAGADPDGAARNAIGARRAALAGTAGDPDRAFTLLEARERGVPLATGVRVEDLTSALDDEITRMLDEVNGVHALRPDNVVGALAALPREVALLAMDQVDLARDVALGLNTHVRVDVEEADGTIRSRWVDAAGRDHAFDPASERWVDPRVWRALATAPRVALTPLLTRAAELRSTTEHAHGHLVRHLREQGRAGGPLVLADGQSARIARYRVIREWARDTVEAAVRAGADDGGAVRAAINARRTALVGTAGDPDRAFALLEARERGVPLPAGVRVEDLTSALDDEITTIINEVNGVHALLPDNVVGAPAALPPEVALLTMDQVHLARELARRLIAHVRVDVEEADGTVRSRWIDPSGRVHIFDPAAGARDPLSADAVTRAGLWSDHARETAGAHGFSGTELAEFYRDSWSHQQTFEQAVLTEARVRLERMGTAHAALPGLFQRAVDAAAASQPLADRLVAQRDRLTRRIAISQAAADRLELQARSLWLPVEELLEEQQRAEDERAEDEREQPGRQDGDVEPPELTRQREQFTAVENRMLEAQERLRKLMEAQALITWELDATRLSLARVEGLVADLRATGQGRPLTGGRTWTADVIRTAEAHLRASALDLDQRRTRLAYRPRDVTNLPAAIDGIRDRLLGAGVGSVAIVVIRDGAGTGGRFLVVNDRAGVRWFEQGSGLEVEPPENVTHLHSLELDGDGRQIDPPEELRASTPAARSFARARDWMLAGIGRHLASPLTSSPAPIAGERQPPTLVRAVAEFEDNVAAQDDPVNLLVGGVERRLMNLFTATRDGVQDDAHFYRNDHGQHAVGPDGLTVRGWTRVGPVAEFRPLFWLLRGGPDQVPSVQDVARGGHLGTAVRYLSGPDSARAERVRELFGKHPRIAAESAARLPDDLPEGAWIWFSGPIGTGTALVVARGHRILFTGSDTTQLLPTEWMTHALGLAPHAIVIGRPATVREVKSILPKRLSSKGKGKGLSTTRQAQTDKRAQLGGQAQLSGQAQPGKDASNHTTRPPARTLQVTVDDPLPSNPHLYVGADGRYRVAAPGLTERGWIDQGAVASYASVSWLIHGGAERPTPLADIVRDEIDAAVGFLTETAMLQETPETVRSLLARATGRPVELTTALPDTLPAGTLVHFTGPRRTGAAVAVADGRFRVLATDGTTSVSERSVGLADVTDGRHTFAIARPATSADLGKKAASTVTTAPSTRSKAFDERRLNDVLRARNLRAIDVPGDGNCFYHSLIEIAGPYLARYIPALASAQTRLEEIQALRNWLADRLAEDFAVANQELPSRYAAFFPTVEGRSITRQQADQVDRIRRMGEWDDEAGDLVAHLAAYELGLRLTLIQDRYVQTLGPQGVGEISFIRRPHHFMGAESTLADPPVIPWERFTPVPATSARSAREQFNRQLRWLDERRGRALRGLAEVTSARSGPARHELHDQVASILTEYGQGAQVGPVLRETPPHARAQRQLDIMGGAVRDLELLVQRESGPRSTASSTRAPAVQSVGADPQVSDHLLAEVNARLLDLGGYWLTGRVDRGQIAAAMQDLTRGGPLRTHGLANEIVSLMAFGAPSRLLRGDAGDAIARTGPQPAARYDGAAVRGAHRSRRTTVDDPLPADPRVYVDAEGQHRVGAAGLTGGTWTYLGSVARYTVVSWLLRGGPEGGLTDQTVVREELDQAIGFITEDNARDEHEETVRSFLADATGRTVERVDLLPEALPEGTLVYYSGTEGVDAAVVLSGSRYRSLTPDGATRVAPDHGGAVPSGSGHTFLIARPGERVYPVEDGAPVPGGDARVIVVDATGRAVEPDVLPTGPYGVDALRLAPQEPGYAAQGVEHE
ncbi:MAG: hypothetical protein JWR24_1213, partial [Actinoallomurus sp.]|nr:hypothetical protein [Actinoallomurus sp.]